MTIYTVEPVTIAAGDSIAMQFVFENSDGSTPDFTGYNGYYVLSPYGFEEENILSVNMTIASGTTNIFKVSLMSEDTISLPDGAYTAKIILENEGNYFKKARGVFNVVKDSDTVDVTV